MPGAAGHPGQAPSVVTATELDMALEVPTDPPDASSILDPDAANSDANTRIAALDGCNHVIHDSCIRLWAQKTNTCPICREPFRQLRVFDGVSEIEEKKQVAEFDPQAWLADNAEEEEAEPEQPCPRMRRARRQARSLAWAGPWGQFAGRVYDALQIDLDNHEDDDALAEFRMSQVLREREQREYQRWQQRVSIASRLGAGEVFTNSLPELRVNSSSNEPLRNQYNPRKRRAPTTSPAEPVQEPERKLKRPRTRRFLPPHSEASGSKPAVAGAARPGEAGPGARIGDPEAPSFLSALLKEVEVGVGTPSDDENVKNYFGRAPTDAASPASSPSISAQNSPRALSLTPPPLSLGRPNSPPLSLSSDQLSPEAKASINCIVRTALKPHWHARELTTEQYSNINRDVSRKLYDEIKDPTLLDNDSMKTWEKVASKEVARAVAESKA
ncbi:unnamed protein product [Parascedosporium putredinis]|uniref:RING-type domain-containing protein n=1 Tax=Parascedosporium putredinis TaxID=1442378 RepID=A0A9P1MEQ7_9PEZI|nr:unnamed protein product [Parascedosporium putredinis]CAI8000978.1 unnamed protein product [Parascedosporium putredinis]